MKIFGYREFQNEKLFLIKDISQINNTPPNSNILFDYNEDILQYVSKEKLPFSVITSSITETLISADFSAKYIVIKGKDLLLNIQKIADTYMFDSKILYLGKNEADIEYCALNGIDGIIFENSIIKEYVK